MDNKTKIKLALRSNNKIQTLKRQLCWKYGDKFCDCKGLCRESC